MVNLIGYFAETLATNQYQPVPAQGYQPNLKILPYEYISTKMQKNDIVHRVRTCKRNPGIQNNPAAAALMAAPT
jgi:hypothetical protein